MPQKTIFINEIGEVDLVKNKRSRNLRITIKLDGKVRVSIPYSCPYNYAEDFVVQQSEKIKIHLENFNKKRLVFDENMTFNTRHHELKINTHNKDKCSYKIKEGQILFFYPNKNDISEHQIQSSIRTAITETFRNEAKQYLPNRVNQLANIYGFKYKKVFVKNMRTRWGSCSSLGNINLNLHLMRLPENLIDYVILHELAHTKERNHGKGFRNLVDSFGINSKLLDKELKVYSTEI